LRVAIQSTLETAVLREEDERGAFDGGVGGHAERVLDLGVDVGEGDDSAGVVHLDDAAHAGIDSLQDGHLDRSATSHRSKILNRRSLHTTLGHLSTVVAASSQGQWPPPKTTR
jgi:hypothetical protein